MERAFDRVKVALHIVCFPLTKGKGDKGGLG